VFDRNTLIGVLLALIGYAIHQLIVTLVYAWRSSKPAPVDADTPVATRMEVRRAAADVARLSQSEIGRLTLSKDADVKRILDAIEASEQRTQKQILALFSAVRSMRRGLKLPDEAEAEAEAEADSQAMMETPSDLSRDTFKPELTWKPEESVTVG
jgi:hypothetical protein